jgi:hypothetical protein
VEYILQSLSLVFLSTVYNKAKFLLMVLFHDHVIGIVATHGQSKFVSQLT